MSVAGILSSSLSDYNASQNAQTAKQAFQQLGKDLRSGNLPAAQSDFVTLQKDVGGAASSQSGNAITQAITQLSQALQSGNLTSAQQAYVALQHALQNAASLYNPSTNGTQTAAQHHHHGDGEQSSAVSQELNQLGQALQSGNLTAAQQNLGTLQAGLQQYTVVNGPASSSRSTALSVYA
jgi:hypothetical protein